MSRRFAAYVLDWLFAVTALGFLCAIAVGILLLASDLNRRDPPAASIYAALVIGTLWLPCWLLSASLAWTWCGATAGMLLVGVRVALPDGSLPSIARSALRAALVGLFSAPALASPLLIAVAASLGTTGPVGLTLPIAALVLASGVAGASPWLSRDREAWHDRLSGTRVVSAAVK